MDETQAENPASTAELKTKTDATLLAKSADSTKGRPANLGLGLITKLSSVPRGLWS